MKIKHDIRILKRRLLFTGYYGMMNTGDDAFCDVCAWGSKKYWKSPDVRFLVKQNSTLPSSAKMVFSNNSILRHSLRAQKVLCFLRNRTLVVGGGSLFFKSIENIKRWNLFVRLRRYRVIKLGAIGVSLGPYEEKNARKSIEKFLSQFSFLVLRDRRSYEEACSIDLPYRPIESFDLAALMAKMHESSTDMVLMNKSQPILGISVCHFERYKKTDIEKEKKREDFMLDAIIKVARATPINIHLFIFNGHPKVGDGEVTQRFVDALKNFADIQVIPYTNEPSFTWKKVAECDAFFGTRLHSGIFSFFNQVPFILVEYHQKCTDFLDDIGWPTEWRIGDFEESPDRTAKVLADMLTGTNNFPIDTKPFIQKAERNFTEIYKQPD
jgi:polysaccharide pyruvyl transferase WcaK-like protein